jgi:putative ABC transport system permease protein
VGRGARTRGLLVAAQLALAIVLVFGANLLIRSFVLARDVDLGFDADGVLLTNLSVPSASDRSGVYRRVVEEVGALPGVSEASVVEDLFIGGAPNRAITVESAEDLEPVVEELRIDAIDGAFFRVLRVPLLRGRDFGAADGASSVPVAIVNETMARRLWPGQDAVGKHFRTEGPEWIEVVGVVPDLRRQGFERAPIAQAFRPYAQAPSRNMNLLVRTDGLAPGLADALRTAVAGIDRTVVVPDVTTVTDALDRYLVERRFQTTLLGAFSLIALVLAAIGIYGLVQYSVSQRTREVGLRIAVGARPGEVVGMMLRQGLAPAVVGMALGMMIALGLSRAVAPLLFDVTPSDPASVTLTAAVLFVTSALACWLPARRATRVDPAAALRGE